VVPETDAGEGVEPSRSSDVCRVELADVFFDDPASADMTRGDESSEPRASVHIELVVDGLSVK